MKERLLTLLMAGMLLFSALSVQWVSFGSTGGTPPMPMSDCQGGGQCGL